MKKVLKEAFGIKVGDSIYEPLSTYSIHNQGAVLISQVESITECDGRVVITDTDGCEVSSDLIGKTLFLSEEDMNAHYNQEGLK